MHNKKAGVKQCKVQQVDGLPWLACPWSPSSWYSKISPSSAHSSFESIAGKSDNNTQWAHMHTWFTPNHATHNSNIEYQKQTCSDIWTNNIFYKENITHIIAKKFLFANKPYSQTNNLQTSICIKTRQPAYIPVATNITEPLQLESIQKKLLVNYNEFPTHTYH
jgi:hypothetical protein